MADVKITLANKAEFIKAIEAKAGKYEAAAVYGLGQVALAVESEAKRMFQGTHKRGEGHVPNTTGGPNVVTGALRRSIHTEIRHGFGSYSASVFPTMVYSRAVEWGSGRKGSTPYPYLTPAVGKVRPKASQIFTAAITRKLKG